MNLYEKLKKWVNKTPIPSLLSFFYNPAAKDPNNPTWDEVKTTAPEPSQNWVRLGLDKMTSFGKPVWTVFLLLAAVLVIYFGSNALQFIINVVSQFGIVIAMGIVLFWIWKSFVKK